VREQSFCSEGKSLECQKKSGRDEPCKEHEKKKGVRGNFSMTRTYLPTQKTQKNEGKHRGKKGDNIWDNCIEYSRK